MEIMNLIDKLETLAGGSRKVPITGQVMVAGERLMELIDQMRLAIPTDTQQASELLERREQILSQTAADARRLKVTAERDARHLVDDSEMVASAKRRAEEIIREAEERAQKIVAAVEVDARGRRHGADEYVRDALSKLEGEVSAVLDTVRRGITAVTPAEEHLTPA